MKAVLFGLVLVACGGGGDPPLDPDSTVVPVDTAPPVDLGPPRETFTSTQILEPGEIIEGEMIGGPADLAVIKLMVPEPELDWNIHSHPNGGTVNVISERDVMTVNYNFVPPEQFSWFLLLKNGGTVNLEVQIQIDLHGAITFGFL